LISNKIRSISAEAAYGNACIWKLQFLSYFNCELLKSANVDRTFFRRIQVAATGTEIARWTHHATCQSQWIVRQDCFGCTIVVLRITGYRHRETRISYSNKIIQISNRILSYIETVVLIKSYMAIHCVINLLY